jgi:hypothetical protein
MLSVVYVQRSLAVGVLDWLAVVSSSPSPSFIGVDIVNIVIDISNRAIAIGKDIVNIIINIDIDKIGILR